MNKLFSMDSPLMQKLSQLPDLIVLHLLWAICSLPVVTMGAATTALHTVVQALIQGTDHGIIRPFFRSFRENFKQSTTLWLPLSALLGLLVLDVSFLAEKAEGAMLLLWIPTLILGAIATVLVSFGFPLIARYDNDLKTVVSNSFLLFSLHFFPALAVMVLNVLPWALMILEPNLFLQTGFLWIVAGSSLPAYIADHILLPVFKKYDPKDPEEN